MDRPLRPSGLRPRTPWFVVPGALVAVGVAAGALTLTGRWNTGLPHRAFTPGEGVTVRLHRQIQADIYVAGEKRPAVRCLAVTPSGRRVAAEPVSGTATVTVDGARWRMLARLQPPTTGRYTVTCGASASRYGISAPPGVGSIAAGFAGGLGLVAAGGMIAYMLLDRRGPRDRPVERPPSWAEPKPQRAG